MKEGWEYRKLGEICDFEGGSQPPKSEWINHPQDGYVRMLQIRDFTKSRNAEDEYVKITKKLRLCKDYDILIGRYVASVGKILTGLAGAYNVAIIKSIPNEELIRKDFIRRYFESLLFQSVLLKVCSSRAAQAGFSKDDIKNELIPLPPLSEQQSIVDYLDSAFAKIDAMKANAEKALNEAKALFQASLKEMLEPKEGWEEKNLQEVACDFSRGKSKHRPRNDKKLFGGNYPFIQTGEIRNANVYVTSHSSTYNEIGLSQSKLWPKGTVCITIAANIAEVAILKYPSCFPDSVIGFVADINKVDKMFVFYSLLHYQQELKKQGKGSAQDNINLGTFEKNRFPFPSLQEQQSIVETLDSLKSKVDRLKANYEKISQECDALKQAILRQVFE